MVDSAFEIYLQQGKSYLFNLYQQKNSRNLIELIKSLNKSNDFVYAIDRPA